MTGARSAPVTPDLDCDVAIVGAGPAGGAAACRLAATGLSVEILERHALPRAKACGGAMPGAVVHDIEGSIDHLVKARIDRQRFLYNHSAKDRLVRMADPMILVDRAEFDAHFINKAVASSQGHVRLRENSRVVGVIEQHDLVTLNFGKGETLRARYVIAADGASSRIARSLGMYHKAAGAGIDAAIRTGAATFAAERDRVTFNLHCVPAGYGWIFPKDDHLSCGVGMWRDPGLLSRAMDVFVARSLPGDDIVDQQRLAHPVPVFSGHRPIATRRVCLVGDAAHLVDPILGEGIKYGIKSGQIAAEVIAHLLNTQTATNLVETGMEEDFAAVLARHATCMAYGDIVRHTIARKLNLIRLREEAFFTNPEAVYQTVVTC